MDKSEAKKVLTMFVKQLKQQSFDQLRLLISNPVSVEVEGESGRHSGIREAWQVLLWLMDIGQDKYSWQEKASSRAEWSINLK